MAKILLDTHAYIWFSEDSPQLSQKARKMIENEDNEAFVSVVSLWEMAIKINIGKLTLNFLAKPPEQHICENPKPLAPTIPKALHGHTQTSHRHRPG